MELNNNDVHIYIAKLEPKNCPTKELTLLPEDELNSTQRFATNELRNCALQTKILTRKILAPYLQLTPKEILIKRKDMEKPSLAAPYEAFHFNISHTQTYFGLAITKNTPIGIDIESTDKKTDILGISKRFFHPNEYNQVLQAQNQEDIFYRIWTQKEAFVKAIGQGISFGLENFCVDAINPKILEINSQEYKAQEFHSQLIKLEHQHYLCITTQKNLDDIKITHLAN